MIVVEGLANTPGRPIFAENEIRRENRGAIRGTSRVTQNIRDTEGFPVCSHMVKEATEPADLALLQANNSPKQKSPAVVYSIDATCPPPGYYRHTLILKALPVQAICLAITW
jgi:hypothetical protein